MEASPQVLLEESFVLELKEILARQLFLHAKILASLEQSLALNAEVALDELQTLNQQKEELLHFSKQAEEKRQAWLAKAKTILARTEGELFLSILYPHIPLSLRSEIYGLQQELKDVLYEVQKLNRSLSTQTRSRLVAIKESVHKIQHYCNKFKVYSGTGTLQNSSHLGLVNQRA